MSMSLSIRPPSDRFPLDVFGQMRRGGRSRVQVGVRSRYELCQRSFRQVVVRSPGLSRVGQYYVKTHRKEKNLH